MIAKIITGNHTKEMVFYNSKKNQKSLSNDKKTDNTEDITNEKKNGKTLGFINTSALDSVSFIKILEDRNKMNTNISSPSIHISLNFHKKDILDNDEMLLIAQDYLNDLGYGEQPYAVYRHFDKEHPHIHIVSSQIDQTGKKINDSFLYKRSQKITRNLELSYGLTKAILTRENQKTNLQENIKNYLFTRSGNITSIIQDSLDEILKERPTTFKELDKRLFNYNILRNQTEKGHNFVIINSDEKKLHEPITGNSLDPDYSYTSILKTLEINKRDNKLLKKNLMGRFYSVWNSKTKFPLSELKLELAKKGIKPIVSRRSSGDKKGEINGMSFVDFNTKLKYKASELRIKVSDIKEKIIDDLAIEEKEEEISLSGLTDQDQQHIRMDPNYIDTALSLSEGFIRAIENSQSLQQEEKRLNKKRKKKKGKGKGRGI